MGAYPSPVSLQDSDTSGTTSLSATTVANSSTKITLSYTGAPFVSATVNASFSGLAAAVGVWNITKGPDGNVWVVSTGIAIVIKVAPSGGVPVYLLSNQSDQPQGIVTGADGNL